MKLANIIGVCLALGFAGEAAATPTPTSLPQATIDGLEVCFDAQGNNADSEEDARTSLRENAGFAFVDYLTSLGQSGRLGRGLIIKQYNSDPAHDAKLYSYSGRACVDLTFYEPNFGDAVLENMDPTEKLSTATGYLWKNHSSTRTETANGTVSTQSTSTFKISFTNRALPWVDDLDRTMKSEPELWKACARAIGIPSMGSKPGEERYSIDKHGITMCYDAVRQEVK